MFVLMRPCLRASEYLKESFVCEGVKKGQGHIVLCSLCLLEQSKESNLNSQSGGTAKLRAWEPACICK